MDLSQRCSMRYALSLRRDRDWPLQPAVIASRDVDADIFTHIGDRLEEARKPKWRKGGRE
jgi:hypothetical protein